MKTLFWLMLLVIVALAGAGVLYHRHANRAAQLQAGDLYEARVRGDRLLEEVTEANREILNLKSSLAQTERSAVQYRRSLKVAEDRVAALEQEQLATSPDLVYAAFMDRYHALVAYAESDVGGARIPFGVAMKAIAEEPGEEAFAQFTARGEVLARALEGFEPRLEEVLKFHADNARMLCVHAEEIASAREQLERLRARIASERVAMQDCLASLRSVQVRVSARDDWQPTELHVRAGEVIVLVARGSWVYDGARATRVTSLGEDAAPDQREFADVASGALLARVRGSGLAFPASRTFPADAQGALELRINDVNRDDNDGTLDVRAWAFTLPPPQPSPTAEAPPGDAP